MGRIAGQKHGRKQLSEMSHRQLEIRADREFSYFIRLRDSDENGYVKCCTCNNYELWKYVDCGHYVKRDMKSTRYDEKNCAGQCKYCNGKSGGKGEKVKHKEYIDKTYGEGTSKILTEKGQEICIRKKIDYIAIILHYRLKVKELKEQKGIK